MSDVLPYETPMIFSNHGLYNYIKDITDNKIPYHKGLTWLLNSQEVGSSKSYTVNVAKPNGDKRELHLPHPAHQVKMSEFLYENSELIISLCSLSNFTIRSPNGVTSYFKLYSGKSLRSFINVDMDVNEDELAEDSNDELGFANSFFTYKKYTLLYKYYKSLEYLSLEKKYKYSGKFDISKCFPSIYTHSISWAVKGKEFSKNNLNSNSFEINFDKLMMRLNDGESHGIIVGPEFSRIFAEIILQRIDTIVENNLYRQGYINKKDYCIHRYVDDYFIYSNEKDMIDSIKCSFKEVLMDFKLYSNESKETITERPFITPLGIAKIQIDQSISQFLSSLKTEDNGSGIRLKLIRNPYQASQSLINEIRLNVKNNNVSVEAFSGLLFSIFREKISATIFEYKKAKENSPANFDKKYETIYTNYMIFCIDIVFFVYSQNIRVRTSYLLAQILILISEFHDSLSYIGKSKIYKKLRDESRIVFRIIDDKNHSHMETINFVITLNELYGKRNKAGSDVKLKSEIENYFFNGLDKFDYFKSVSALYVLSKDKKNSKIIDHIHSLYKEALTKKNSNQNKTELTFFLLDFLKFPHLRNSDRNEIILLYFENVLKRSISRYRASIVRSKLTRNDFWFVDWDSDMDIRKVLLRKEAQSTYN